MSPFEMLRADTAGHDHPKVRSLIGHVTEIDRRLTAFEITRAEHDDLVRDALDMTQVERDACTLEELRALDEAAALLAKALRLA